MNTPLALSDRQLLDITEVGRGLPRWQRGDYLKAVAEELAGKTPGDGSVHLAARRAARKVDRMRSIGAG